MSDKPKALRIAEDVVALWDNGAFEREDAEEIEVELLRMHAECEALRKDAERLLAVSLELDKLMLVIASAVRWQDKTYHAAVVALVKANRAAIDAARKP